MLTHCQRELMHEAWKLLLDAEFVHAYIHGIILKCADGVYRRVYPRIFTYSADYPEKYALIPSMTEHQQMIASYAEYSSQISEIMGHVCVPVVSFPRRKLIKWASYMI